MENPIKMDDLGVPLFLETPIYHRNQQYVGKYASPMDPMGYKLVFGKELLFGANRAYG